MSLPVAPVWSRRQWLTRHALTMAAVPLGGPLLLGRRADGGGGPAGMARPAQATRLAAQAERLDPTPWQAMAQQAVDAARTAGARYAEARLSRIVSHRYGVAVVGEQEPALTGDDELVGVGVRALVDGYWGFAASTAIAPDEVVRLAQAAVRQARENAKGTPWTVDLGQYPVATGTWMTPCRIDPFTVPIEEKLAFITYWNHCLGQAGLSLYDEGRPSHLTFVRQERVVATSDGALFTQTLLESGGFYVVAGGGGGGLPGASRRGAPIAAHGIDMAGAGWELFLDAKIPEQILSGQLAQEAAVQKAIPSKPFTLGRYTLVCDGATMASIVEATLGEATQLDRALGYEADARGTSFITDPLAMVGQLQVAAPHVTITANRSAPRELATVKWDEEGVVPEPFTVVKDGVLVDFQTTREQAAWLAPYYQAHGLPVRSHGCAGAESAHVVPLQHMPNLAFEPSASAIGLDDLIKEVPDGILIERGAVVSQDAQGRTGLLITGLGGGMREIKNGRVGAGLSGGGVLFDSVSLWTHLQAVGGASTVGGFGASAYRNLYDEIRDPFQTLKFRLKGQPPQRTSHTVRAAAATLPNQPLINPSKKA